MVRPFVYPPSWKTPPFPGHVFGPSGLLPSDRGSSSNGTANSSRGSPGTAARMAETFCWVYGARQESSRPRGQSATLRLSTSQQSALRKNPPNPNPRPRHFRKRHCRLASACPSPRNHSREQHRLPSRVRYRVGSGRLLSRLLRRTRKGKFTIRARPLVPKGKLCNPKRSFHISGAVSRTKTRPQNPRSRRLQ